MTKMDTLPTLIDLAVKKVAPLWPLDGFVAVNPFLGHAETSWAEAGGAVAASLGARATMSRAWFAAEIAAGRIADADLTAAIDATPGAPDTIEALQSATLVPAPTPKAHPTVANLLGASGLVIEEIGRFLAATHDRGQALVPAPAPATTAPTLFAAWKAGAAHDRTAQVAGFGPAHDAIAALPDTAAEALATALEHLGLSDEMLPAYIDRAYGTFPGWAGFVRHLDWKDDLAGITGGRMAEILAIRVAWDHALLVAGGPKAAALWEAARPVLAEPVTPLDPVDLALHAALDNAWHRTLEGGLDMEAEIDAPGSEARPPLQAAFCIDVRSEPFRRALEAALPGTRTIGFAGFFGVPMAMTPFNGSQDVAHLPVLLPAAYTIPERPKDPTDAERLTTLSTLSQGLRKAWKSFRSSTVSTFAFVETMGLGYTAKLAADSAGLSRQASFTGPDTLAPDWKAGIPQADRVGLAKGILGGMSLGAPFAPIVLLAGHGARVTNNPHATGLACGACGGQSGTASARVVAGLLNDPEVRAGLARAGIAIPADTTFVPALHDTTTDAVTLFDTGAADGPALELVRSALAIAGKTTRAERAPSLHRKTGEELWAKALDWAEVRPEWGLAGCAAFIAAPRARTEGTSLAGRSFLHSYDWRKDEDFGVLELIMTAPMVVASWISLGYYGATVDNAVFGSGDKTLHNIAGGGLGVLEGNGGDLRPGLPIQSVHDGQKAMHDPVRLSVVLEAPIQAITDVLARHGGVRALADNGWITLFALDPTKGGLNRYEGDLSWAPFSGTAPLSIAA